MSIIGSNIIAGASGSGVEAYQIEQSLRFDGSSGYLSRTHSNSNTSSDFTLSMWIKKAYNGENNMMLLHTNTDPRYSYMSFGESSGDADLLIARGTSSGYAFNTSRKYRDPSAWYHIVLSVDVGTITEGYINGVLDQNTGATGSWHFNGSDAQAIGRQAGASSDFFSGYMAEVHFIDGQALDADNFGEFDDNGVWRPIEYTGTYGDNGYYLKFDPDATNGVGHDHSGNGNNWTASGFTTSGTGTDVMSDTPTNNYCTLNPLAVTASTGTMSDGNLVGTTTVSNGGNMYGTFALPSTGKWYWEVVSNSGNGAIIGIGEYDPTEDQAWELSNSAFIYDYPSQGQKIVDGTASTYGSDFTNGDLIGVACDADADTIEFYINGTAQGSISHAIGGLFPCLCDGSDSAAACTLTVNFGQRAFEQTPPSGYKALNTSNLPAPDIADGSAYFNTVLYSGNASTQSITGVGFQPDWVWAKSRSTRHNFLFDAVRGATNYLVSSLDEAETDNNDTLTSFDTDGFSLGTSSGTNASGENFVAWNWLAANGTSTNTDGNISGTVTVSANPTAGFSIVSYTGTGSSATVGHGLGVAPDMVIAKARDGGDHGWGVYHRYGSQGAETQLQLHSTTAPNTGTSFWNGTHPTSTVFTVNTSSATNNSGSNMIAYCFAPVEGYSKFGSYTGTNSSDGPVVHLGFKPAFLIIKSSTSGENWHIKDSTRDTYNPIAATLLANANNSELNLTDSIDLLSNGFKLRTNSYSGENSANTFIYAAFAEHPFGGSGVSPATAR